MRKEELKEAFANADDEIKAIVAPLFEEMEFIESQLVELKKQPLIKYHPQNPNIQKLTPASRLYKDLLSQEKDLVRILCSLLHKDSSEGSESPLREYMRKRGGL